ncbi:non-ribosomal peptide synthetase [Pseudomonas chlororaphis]|uniref:Non-ribosomal peptide synthetase n=1 Tax=Pseudomonas chlororaphis TaxID=587753 RepID=A0A1Q8ENZ0_9PSED|nr:non-ribosomal peptide synthetase [Pseudomonas chlororaphis]OLF53508.1 non-ribosomal peptide synthetase [Pseudomonas chlororaphis]
MSMLELLATLKAKDIQLALKGDQLLVQGNKQALSEPAVLALLREHKPALIELIRAGDYSASKAGQVEVPANVIAVDAERITPAMLPLASLDQEAIDRIVASVPGGVANVQDIYPLAPLQRGILYHHASAAQGDPYVLQAQFAFTDAGRLAAFAEALQGVIDRHDILRTAVHWQGLEEPVQVVWRQAALVCEEIGLDPAAGEVAEQLRAAFDPRHYRLDVTRAPLIRLMHASDPARQRVVAVLLFHHMALDHSALDVVRHELQAFLSGEGRQLGPAVPFRNYVAQACLGTSEQEHEAFFRQMLGDIDEPTLPFGLQDVQGDGSAIGEFDLPLAAPLSQGLRQQARQAGVSAASLFHLAWALVLGALSGRQQVVFGTVLMGRMQGGGDNDRALGMFINTLPLRVSLGAQSVQDALKATHGRLTALLRHEHAPLALAQRCSGVAAPTPLFSALLNYRHSAAPAAVEPSAAWQGISNLSAHERSNYPLTLSVNDLGEGFSLSLLAVESVDAARICGYMQAALEQLVQALEQAPQRALEQLSILAPAEREHLLHGFNASHRQFPAPQTVHRRIEARAAATPHALAAVCLEQSLSYAELNARANALAHHLRTLGVGPDERVAIVARRGLETLVGLLAILKAGAAYVPVDPAHPAERIAYLLQDSAPRAVLSQSGLLARLPALTVPVIALDTFDGKAHSPDNPQVPGLSPANLAYVIYTSGSTGLPKGVMVEHRSLENLVHWHCAAFDLGPGSHTSSVAGFGFDAMAWEVWPALCVGATLHLPPAELGNEQIDALLDWWRAQPLDVSFLPTPVAEYAFGQDQEHPTLRTLLIGGDRLRQFARNQRFAVINNYGPTEATVVATSGRVEAGGPLHIGQPVANARVYLLDEQLQPVPVGVAGELYVGGAGVARGYLNRPELSAERFIDDPFSDLADARLYRTGDLARWLADGSIEYLGRNDDQVKIRGVRIELGEIETCLNQLPGIQEAVVLAREDEPGHPRLVAYFTAQPQVEALAVGELRACLMARLPDYMVPTAYVPLDSLPLTANGKLDRKALPKPQDDALFSRAYEAPQGELEQALAQIWAEVLKVERVGRQDHFFELGGHSLLAMRMVSQVRQRLGVELALGELFANAELAAVARVLAEAGRSTLPPILPAPRDEPLPLSFAQQRLWFLAQMGGASATYNIPLGLRLRGRLDVSALQRALARIVARHESLRSRFVACDDEPRVLLAAADEALDLPVEDLRHRPQAQQTVQALLREEAAEPFDLQRGPLLRGRLLALADDEHVLLLTLHHIITDGWSMGVLTGELTALYQAFSQGRDDPLPPLAVQYGDFALWQRRWLDGELLQRQGAYWQQALGGAPALLMLPTDRPRPAQQDHRGQRLEVLLDEPLSAALKALAQRHGCTLYMVMMAAWAQLLARLAGQAEVVIGSPVANRANAEVEGLIGLFVNTLAVRIDTAGAPSVEALLARVKACTLQAQAHQDLPFERVVELLRPVRSLSHSPLFQTLLSWENHDGPQLELGELRLEGLAAAGEVAKFDLSLSLGEVRGRIGGSLEYATALFDAATLQRYLGYFTRLLQAMVGNDQAPLEQVALLDERERRQLLEGLNATARDYDLEQTIHGLFEAQAQRTPEALAVKAGAQSLSYRALNQRANQLAHYLREQGVGPDSRVAICVERGLEMVVGLLAILKAGGGYVPLDPAYPPERIAYMLEDSAPVAVLAQGATRGLLGEVPVIDLERPLWQDRSLDNPRIPELTPRHLVYVIYTSGSTGKPKGVINEHRAVVNRLLWMQEEYALDAADAVLQKTPFSFDVSVWEFFWPLMTGARLVMARPEGHKDPAYLGEVIEAEKISTLHFVPSMLDVFLAHGDSARCAGLTRVLCSGEALPGSLVRRFKTQLPGTELHNLYGPTEAAVDVTAWHCAGPVEQTPDNTPIGKPIANTRMYLLDEQLQPVPLGVVGELYIGGVQVARGYLHRPQLSAERFLKDPFRDEPQARMYRTGDVGRYLPDGVIEYLGRNDDQVKIRGLRIELGEIQARLTQFPGIKEAVVVAREDVPGDKRLVAYYTTEAANAAPEAEALRSHLLEQLPEYMLPAAFVPLDALPLSPNGKLDRKALPAPDLEALRVREYEAPVGDTEILLAQIWAELLNLERVGRHDHFFELGGHSLLAVNLIARMRRVGLAADVRVLFGQPTLAALAAAVGDGREVAVPANGIVPGAERIVPAMLPLASLDQEAIERLVASVPGGVANVQDIYALAPLQAGILYHHIAARQGDPYVLQAQFAFASPERLAAFVLALQAVIERHDILRSSMHWKGLEEPVQVVWRQAPLVCEAVAVDAAQGDVLGQLQARFEPRQYRLDLAQAPLLRLVHAHDPVNRRVVALLLFHHLVMDHLALEVLQYEMQAWLLGEGEHLGPAVPYRNYVAQTRLGVGEQEHEAFFRQMLADFDQPTRPFALAAPTGEGDSEAAQVLLDSGLSRRLRVQARQLGIGVASLMHLAWAQLLSRVSNQSSVVFGTVLLGRMQGGEGAERALGVFINTLPLRVDLADQEVAEAALATHGRLSQLLGHEHAPLALVQRCSAVAPATPLFSTLLNYRHSAPAEALADAAATAWQGMQLLNAEERSNYLLTLSVDDLGEDFQLTALALPGIGAQRICGYMQVVLEHLAQALEQAPQTPVETLEILGAEERRQLLEGFNASARDFPHEQTVHRLFEAQARARPEATAAVHGPQALSYGQLNARANRLAHHLLALGVCPGATVAILLERSLDLLVSQLAVCKCAAVYVPLDRHAPAERQGFILEDCQAALLLTRSDETLGGAVRRVELDRLDLAGQPNHDPGLEQSSEAVAYIMYTSGSTGAPKGVLVPHRGITRLVLNNGYADFNAGDRVAFASNPAFDASTMDVWGALLNGAQVQVIDHHTLLDPLRFGAALKSTGSSVLFVTTALFNQYVQLIPEALKGLRILLCGGERADPAAFRRLLAQAPDLRLVHCYGPTETTTYATTHEVRTLAADAESVPVGRPISNTQVYVLDARQQPVPQGVVGEIYIGGHGVAKGYLNRAALTAEKFLHDPFNPRPDGLMYRTGDLGRWLDQGLLECLGRNDDQVKIRGFRIELGEIEARLATCPGVREVVVLAREDEPGDKRLVAYCSLERPVSVEQLRGYLQGRLPDYMVPAAYVLLERLPLTGNGKVDRKALPAPQLDALAHAVYEAPVGPLEQRLAQAWAEVLKLSQVGRHDSFFELGGHSLLAIRLVNLLQEAGLELTLAELFEHASVASVAALLGQRDAAPQRDETLVRVRSGGSQPPLFLVHEFSGLDVYFPALGQHIPGDFPIYGLPGVALGQPQLHTMQCLAARLVTIIRGVQAEGPYRLAGWSFGGVLAYEIALQLIGQDQPVEFLGLIDSYVPRLTDQGKARWSGDNALKLHLLLQCSLYWKAQGAAGGAALASLDGLQRQLDELDVAALLRRCRSEQLLYPEMAAASDTDLLYFLEREVGHGHALAHYSLAAYPLPVHLFCAEERPTELSRRSRRLGWDAVLAADRLRAIDVPGDHQSMMQAPHIRALGRAMGEALQASAAEHAAAAPRTPYQPVLRIQGGAAGQWPIVCVPGAGDSVTGFIGLTDALGPDWPILGLQPRGLEGDAVPHSRVESAAAYYLDALEQQYPTGPLHLIGHSFGGWVAFEMAVLLEAKGREVASLTLIDSEAPGGDGVVGKPYTTTAALHRLIDAMQLASGQSLGIDPRAFAMAEDVAQLEQLHAGMVRVGLMSPRSTPEAMHGPARTFASALRTLYQPRQRYQGRARLVLADDPGLDAAGNRREQQAMVEGWRGQVAGLEVWHGPGNHFSLLKAPHVASLAAWWHEGRSVPTGEGVS